MADDTLTITINGDASGFNDMVPSLLERMKQLKAEGQKPNYGASLASALGFSDQALQEVTTLFDQIGTSAQRNFNEAVVGAESWQKAMTRIVQGVETAFLNMVETEVARYLIGETSKTAATEAGNAARTASDAAAATSGDAGILTSVLRSISASAKEAFAGVFGFLSPELGPAAAGPAAAAEASVMAAASGLPAMAVGAWNLDDDMVAQLHQGEMVVPQTFAEGLRQNGGMAGAGGDSYQVTINAVDSQSVKNLLQGNAGLIAQIMQKQVRNFSSATAGLAQR